MTFALKLYFPTFVSWRIWTRVLWAAGGRNRKASQTTWFRYVRPEIVSNVVKRFKRSFFGISLSEVSSSIRSSLNYSNSSRTFFRLEGDVAKCETIVYVTYWVVAVPAKKKSINSSMMSSSVNTSGYSRNNVRMSLQTLACLLPYCLSRIYVLMKLRTVRQFSLAYLW